MDQIEKDIIFWAKKWRIPHQDIKDVAQELRIKLWQADSRFDSSKGTKKRTWQNVIIRNCLKNLSRTASRSKDALDRAILLSDMDFLANNQDFL